MYSVLLIHYFINNLPKELLHIIENYLQKKDIIKLGSLNHKFYNKTKHIRFSFLQKKIKYSFGNQNYGYGIIRSRLFYNPNIKSKKPFQCHICNYNSFIFKKFLIANNIRYNTEFLVCLKCINNDYLDLRDIEITYSLF